MPLPYLFCQERKKLKKERKQQVKRAKEAAKQRQRLEKRQQKEKKKLLLEQKKEAERETKRRIEEQKRRVKEEKKRAKNSKASRQHEARRMLGLDADMREELPLSPDLQAPGLDYTMELPPSPLEMEQEHQVWPRDRMLNHNNACFLPPSLR